MTLDEYRNICQEKGLLETTICNNVYYCFSNKSKCWIAHFSNDGEIEIATTWRIYEYFLEPFSPIELNSNITLKEFSKKIDDLLLKRKKIVIKQRKKEIYKDF